MLNTLALLVLITCHAQATPTGLVRRDANACACGDLVYHCTVPSLTGATVLGGSWAVTNIGMRYSYTTMIGRFRTCNLCPAMEFEHVSSEQMERTRQARYLCLPSWWDTDFAVNIHPVQLLGREWDTLPLETALTS